MKRQRGFTLIEVIVVLVLVGIMAALAGFGLVTAVQGYLMAAENAAVTQKAQTALTRITRELRVCHDCSGTAGAISLPLTFNTGDVNLGVRTVDFDAGTGELLLGSPGGTHTLVDGVSGFVLAYDAEGRMEVSLTIQHQQGGGGQTFETLIYPRNTP